MPSQLAVISARARRLHRILSRTAGLTPAVEAAKVCEEAAEAAAAAAAGDSGGLMHELADVIVAATQTALTADPDGLDVLWQELADTLAADLARDWHVTASGVIRHRPRTWAQADLDAIAEQAVTELRTARPGSGRVRATIRVRPVGRARTAVRGASAGGDLRLLASGLLAQTRLSGRPDDTISLDDARWDGHTLTVTATLARGAVEWIIPHPAGGGAGR